METVPPQISSAIIDGLNGTTAVARMLLLPPSTVHSWRRIGMSPSRAAHLHLAASAAGKTVDFVTGSVGDGHGSDDYADAPDRAPEKIGKISPRCCALSGGNE